MSSLHDSVLELRKKAARGTSARDIFNGLKEAMTAHSEELIDINVSVCLKSTDTDDCFCAEIKNDKITFYEEEKPADVTISGSSESLLSLFSGKLSPPKAILFRKIQIKGDIKALSKLSRFI